MTNVLEAIANIVENIDGLLEDQPDVGNQMNQQGESLEAYVKDAFASSIGDTTQDKRRKHSLEFSYLGSSVKPPDLMIRGGDAIEVKKLISSKGNIQLNSSPPKATLSSDSTMIAASCRECEDWTTKDLIYAVGHVKSGTNQLLSIWFVSGSVYAAEARVYEDIRKRISEATNSAEDIEFGETVELARINKVDPLGITHFRVRGMWIIEHPSVVFEEYLAEQDLAEGFTPRVVCVIPKTKYDGFPDTSRNRVERMDHIQIFDTELKDPSNPANLIPGKILIA